MIPLARAVAKEEIIKGLAICGSVVGACVVTNKVPGVRAALITGPCSAHIRVEDDDMNIICRGGNVTGYSLALELVRIFLNASFMDTKRYVHRLRKVSALKMGKPVDKEHKTESNLAMYSILKRTSKQPLMFFAPTFSTNDSLCISKFFKFDPA
jgi:hypothetical protein